MYINKRVKIIGIVILILIILSTLKISYANTNEEIRVPKDAVRLVNDKILINQSLRAVSSDDYNLTCYQLNHTKEEIIERYNDSRRVTTKNSYSQLFSKNAVFTDNLQEEAVLSDQAIIDTLNELNYMRFLAGEYADDETISNDGNPYCGKGAVLLSQSNFSHKPEKPTKFSMTDEFYSDALFGTGQGHTFEEYAAVMNDVPYNGLGANISAGTYCDIVDSIKIWLDDSGQIGHRVSLLSPYATYCSIGSCHNTNPALSYIYDYDSLLQFMNYDYSKYANTYYTWPAAGYCPIESVYAKDRIQPEDLPVYWSITFINTNSIYDYSDLSIKVTYNGTDYDISEIYTDLDPYGFENTLYFVMNSTVLNNISKKITNSSQYYETKYIAGKSVTITVYDEDDNVVISYPVNFFSEDEVIVNSINIDLDEATLDVGDTVQLNTTVDSFNGSSNDIVWTTSNSNVATVNNGLVTAKGAGEATITATIGDKSDTCLITVNEPPVSFTIDLNYTEKTIEVGQSFVLQPSSIKVGNNTYSVHYTSSNPAVASCTRFMIKGVSAGVATITAECQGITATCIVTVIENNEPEPEVTGISLNKSNLSLYVGGTSKLYATVTTTGTMNYTINWSSSKPSVATVDNNGNITACGVGSTTITASVNGFSATCTVNVTEEPKVTGISLNTNSITLYEGNKTKLNATVTTIGSPSYSVVWSSSSNSIAKVSQDGTVTAVKEGQATIKASCSGYSAICLVTVKKESVEEYANIEYRSYVESLGWENSWKTNGELSGTSGKSLKLESLQVKLDSNISGSVEYCSHIEIYGWESSYKKDGATSGAAWLNLRMEAVKIRLTGDIANKYDIYYRLHVQNIGWLDWACNGKEAGSSGYGYRVEAIEIKLVLKGEPAPGFVLDSYREKGKEIKVTYSTHVQNIGDQAFVSNGAIAGTSGRSLRLESIRIKLENVEGSIEYRTHIQNIGWESSYKKDGARSGTSGQSLRLEAIQIRLTGKVAEEYDVYYRVHAQNIGWMSWAKNGEESGTANHSFRLEGIQIVLVKKGSNPPAYNPPANSTLSFYK